MAGWLDYGPSPRPPAQDRALSEREERHGACSYPQGKCPLPLPWRASWEPPIWKENQGPTWTGPEKGTGKMGKQAEAGSGACGELDCASQGGPGAGVGGCQPCGGLGWTFLWSPSQNGFGVPPTKDLVWTAEGRGTLRPGASRAHPWRLLWPSPLMARCGSTGQLPTLPTWSPKPRGKWGGKRTLRKRQ